MQILVTWPGYRPNDSTTGARLVECGYELALAPKLGARTPHELAALLGDAVAAIVSTDPFTAEVIRAAPRLRVIARVGVSTDSIDRAAADAAGVAIVITPGMNTEAVADHTLALMLALVRKIAVQNQLVRMGRWERVGLFLPTEMAGLTVGLIGAGAIGQAVIRRLHGFGVNILVFDPAIQALPGVEVVADLGALLERADMVSLHAPLTEATRHIIDGKALAAMKPSALLINTARGALVDEAALLQSLRSRQIAGAGLDVFEVEPLDPQPFAEFDQVVLSPHLAGLSHVSLRRMTESATASVLAFLDGHLPDTVINREAVIARRNRL